MDVLGIGAETARHLDFHALIRVRCRSARYHFFDSDNLVEQGTGTTVAHIFEEEGEEGFREAETSVMQVQIQCAAV